MMKKILGLFIGMVSISALAETILDATYTLKWGSTTIGKVQRQLVKNGDTYTFTSYAKPQGLAVFLTKGIDEKSVFKVKDSKIIPVSYSYHQKGKKSKEVAHHYHWGSKTLTILKPKSLTVKNINNNTVDALNSQYMVMLGLINGKRTFDVAMYDDSPKPKAYKLTQSGNIKINAPAGRFDTVLVSKAQTDLRKFNLWCAPSLNYLPVKISHVNEKGQTFTMELVKINK